MEALPWVTSEIRSMMNKRCKVLKKAQETNKPGLWKKYRKLRNEVTKGLRNSKEEYYREMFTCVKTTKVYWKLLKKATKPMQNQEIGPIKRENGTLCVKGMEKAELFNNYFANVGQNLAKELPTANADKTASYIHRVTPAMDTIKVDPKRVKQLVTNLKQDKAPGPDNISPKLLKTAGESIVPLLVSLFNITVNFNKLPNVWKTARMSSVFKKGYKSDKKNYRPLSNLCLPSKVMECWIQSRNM